MSKQPKISIIVPIYNVELYIRQCLESLVSQTFADIEIICVDDCSPDNSIDIVKEFAAIDDRVKLIKHDKNSGISVTRNTGIKNSMAKYIMFCDSDDFFKIDMCEKMFDAVENSGADFGVCGTDVIYESDSRMRESDDDYFNIKTSGVFEIDDMMISEINVALWNKIFRRDILISHDISFPDGIKYEDNHFFRIYCLWANSVYLLKEKLYCYRRRAGGIMNQTFANNNSFASDYVKIAIAFYDYLIKHNLYDVKMHYFWHCFWNYFMFANPHHNLSMDSSYELARDFIQENRPPRGSIPFWLDRQLDIIMNKTVNPRKFFGGALKIKENTEKKKLYLFGITLLETKYSEHDKKYDLFGLRVWKKKNFKMSAAKESESGTLLDRIKKDIDSATVVSFDIFDTLLFRPYTRPVDLFLHLEQIENAPSFCEERIGAEIKARRKNKNCEDITLDLIYNEIGETFLPMKEKELALEMQVLTQNPEIKAVWDYAKSVGKKIIVASDMYLPTDFIAAVLKKKGFDDYDNLYVSGQLGKTKHCGTMYRHIISDLKIKPEYFLHIGDNKNADFESALNFGCKSVLYKQLIWQYLDANPRAKMYREQIGDGNIGGSITLMLLAMRWQKKKLGLIESNYWNDIGYEFGGPSIFAFANWIEYESKNLGIKNLFFVARDGYTIQKVFDTFDSGIKTNYVYAPRFMNLICRLNYSRQDATQPRAIIEYFSEKSKEIKGMTKGVDLGDGNKTNEIIFKNIKQFEELAEIESQNYRNYLGKFNTGNEKVGIVDTITGMFSAQKVIQNAFSKGKFFHGFYWSVINYGLESIFQHSTFAQEKEDTRIKNWNFIEFLMTAPEYPIKRISKDGSPIYAKNPNNWECTRLEIYPFVSAGAVDFAIDAKSVFGGIDLFLDGQTIAKHINNFCDNPTKKDIKKMQIIRHACDSAHSVYIPLFSRKLNIIDFVFHPIRSYKELKNTYWHTPFQTFILCTLSPIKIKFGGLKRLQIFVFPKLQKRYFDVQLNFTPNCFYEFTIGRFWER